MDNKKKSAAIAAVFNYIKTHEEAAAASYVPEVQEPLPNFPSQMAAQPAQNMNLWGFSGREAHMQTRSMMQLRMFK